MFIIGLLKFIFLFVLIVFIITMLRLVIAVRRNIPGRGTGRTDRNSEGSRREEAKGKTIELDKDQYKVE